MLRSKIFLALTLAAPTLLGGCNGYRLKPPVGFAEVEKNPYGAHMKASDGVGLSVRVFHNVRGGTLAYWSADLVDKLGKRGYTLVAQSPTRSKNGVTGTRFDFAYVPPGTDENKFYSVVLFTTDKRRVVIQLAGDQEIGPRYLRQVDEIASATRVRGCRSWTKVCRGPQPAKLQTPQKDKKVSEPEADTALADNNPGQ